MAKILPQFARWTPVALDVLRETASRYGAVITVSDLADEVLKRTRVESPTSRRTWLGDLMEITALAAARAGDPPLTSLAVQRDGTVGDVYGRAVLAATGDVVKNVEQRAAEDRLLCYQALATDLPADGGTPRPARVRTTRAASGSTTTVKRAVKPEDRPAKICPTCFMALPATGICDNCD
ncbi:hypothetical protein [Aeromicrobium sp. Leaf291]|uniref:hypothetical protein n=1 Tax=Aeromicrobium sp. Leaf291 TaxID=1736325 RepID=UPI0006F3A234|nr:hypothetical protein [Aeromicrobium sp. Leaf291]KQP82172.1 hypothetical protein ASF35_12060 [Aeromicrobium sp. Leaf291]